MTTADRILVIDDDEVVGELVAASARAMGLHCVATRDVKTFLNLVTPETTLILLDLMMPEMDGIEVLRLLGERRCKARILLISGMNKRVLETAEKLAQTLGLSVVGHLQKPFQLAELKKVLGAHAAPETADAGKESPQIAITDEQLHGAFARNEFVVHYQPQIGIATGEVTGVEALSRWQHPELGLILPERFLARAEALGLMDKLCWLTADRALAEVKQFAGRDGTLPRLSLNASVRTLRDLKFPDLLVSLATRHNVPTEKIAVEITETGLIQELSRTLDVLTRLRMKGIQLSIDDFGSGYAMMRQLQNVPATELKIDQHLVWNMHANGSDRVMVEKIIEMGHALDMEVIAEGVKTREQLDLLRQRGCDGAQGYLFSPPLPAGEMATWLAAHRSGQVQ
ncbi:MAG: EAL domain-containing response regulator [Terracidiphilus sp.]|jgi:EAL domain-containing protein (putative c-di-GMP-specific phosphodiesterase class I)/FixJ family two-component response regulator